MSKWEKLRYVAELLDFCMSSDRRAVEDFVKRANDDPIRAMMGFDAHDLRHAARAYWFSRFRDALIDTSENEHSMETAAQRIERLYLSAGENAQRKARNLPERSTDHVAALRAQEDVAALYEIYETLGEQM